MKEWKNYNVKCRIVGSKKVKVRGKMLEEVLL